jgi:HPt (histidine-containing phosphotransfer) domain-containing protein
MFLLEMTGEDTELANDMIRFFLTNAGKYLETLETLKESPDEWRLMAHKFKGAGRSIGAKGLADLLQLAEDIDHKEQQKRQEIIDGIGIILKNISLVKI